MKLRVELASNELTKFIEEHFRDKHNEEVWGFHCHWGYFTQDEFEELVKKTYDKFKRTMFGLNPVVEYRSNKADGKQQLDREKLDRIISDFVAKEYRLRVKSIDYAMLIDKHCVYQVENPILAYNITGKTIAECEVEKIVGVTLESDLSKY